MSRSNMPTTFVMSACCPLRLLYGWPCRRRRQTLKSECNNNAIMRNHLQEPMLIGRTIDCAGKIDWTLSISLSDDVSTVVPDEYKYLHAHASLDDTTGNIASSVRFPKNPLPSWVMNLDPTPSKLLLVKISLLMRSLQMAGRLFCFRPK